MIWVLIGVALLISGIGLPSFFARKNLNRARTIADVPQYDCAQVAEHGAQAPGMRVSVHGRVTPLPTGALRAPETERECGWYRLTISERIRESSRDSDGRTSTSEREKVVSEERSVDPIMLDDGTGVIRIDPMTAQVDRPVETFNRLEKPPTKETATISFGKLSLSLSGADGVVGIRKREEIIPIGSTIYVLGGAFDIDGVGSIGAPSNGHYIISLRSADELVRAAKKHTRLWAALAAGLGVLGVVVIVIGIVSG
jgi:hypothetical protein